MGFQPIDMKIWPRAEHFEYYSGLLKTNYQIAGFKIFPGDKLCTVPEGGRKDSAAFFRVCESCGRRWISHFETDTGHPETMRCL